MWLQRSMCPYMPCLAWTCVLTCDLIGWVGYHTFVYVCVPCNKCKELQCAKLRTRCSCIYKKLQVSSFLLCYYLYRNEFCHLPIFTMHIIESFFPSKPHKILFVFFCILHSWYLTYKYCFYGENDKAVIITMWQILFLLRPHIIQPLFIREIQ